MVTTKHAGEGYLIEALALGNNSGLGQQTRIVVEALTKILWDKKVYLIVRKDQNLKIPVGWKCIKTTGKPYRFWYLFAMPWYVLKNRPKIALCLGQTIPFLKMGIPYYFLVGDIGPLEDLGFQTSKYNRQNRRALNAMLHRADKILTVSQFSKNRIVSLTGLSHQKIHSYKPIWKKSFLDSDRLLPVDHGPIPNPENPFIFSMGNIEPRKNFPTLITGYAQLVKKYPEAPRLIIAGKKVWGWEELKMTLEKSGVKDRVILPGYISDNEKKWFYQHCLFYVSSAIYEGWGIPLFDALQSCKPAIYHRESAQAEFAEGFAIAVNCQSPVELEKAMETLYLSADKRQEIVENLSRNFSQVTDYDLAKRLGEILSA